MREPRTSAGWALALLAAIYTCGFVDRIILQVLVEPIREEFALSDTQIGLLGGIAFALLNVLLGLWFARIAERRRRITLIAIGTLAWSAATAACGLAANFVQLFLARVAVGVGEALGLPSTQSVVSDYFPRTARTTALSVLWIATPLGSLIGSAGGALVAQAYGWRFAFVAIGAPGLLLAILLFLTVGEPRRGRYDGLPAASADQVPPLRSVVSRMWNRRSLRHILIGSNIGAVAGFGINAFLAAWLMRRFGFTLAEAGIAIGLINSGPVLLGIVGAGWLSDRLARADARSYGFVPGVALALACPLFMLAVTRDSASGALPLLGVAAVFQYSYLASYSGTLQNMMHPRMRASATAVMSLVAALVGGGLGPLAVGMLSDALGSGAAGDGGGLTRAFFVVGGIYAWAAGHLLWSTRSLREDLAAPLQDP